MTLGANGPVRIRAGLFRTLDLTRTLLIRQHRDIAGRFPARGERHDHRDNHPGAEDHRMP